MFCFFRLSRDPLATAANIMPATLSASMRIMSADIPTSSRAINPSNSAVATAAVKPKIISTVRCMRRQQLSPTYPVLCQCCDRDFHSCTWFHRDDTLPFLNRIVLTVIGRLPPPATIPTAPDGTRSECRVESAPSRSELRSMFARKLADHLVIGDLDALVGRDATLIAAMTPQLPYRAGQPSATVRSIETKKSPGLGVGASLDERKARGLGGLRDLPYTVSTPIAPVQFPHGSAPTRMLAESAVKCNLIAEMAGILPK